VDLAGGVADAVVRVGPPVRGRDRRVAYSHECTDTRVPIRDPHVEHHPPPTCPSDETESGSRSRARERVVKLVELTRQAEDGTPEVMAAVGPLKDEEGDAYAARLGQLIGQRGCEWLSVRTTPVRSTSGKAADPAADPDTLLTTVLESGIGEEGERDLPESPRDS
jgi:hypothetical protein